MKLLREKACGKMHDSFSYAKNLSGPSICTKASPKPPPTTLGTLLRIFQMDIKAQTARLSSIESKDTAKRGREA